MGIPLELIIALISLVIGLFIGFLISSLRSERDAQAARLEQVVAEPEKPQPGVILYRESPDQPLQVTCDGRLFNSVYEVTPQFRSKLEEAAFDFFKWLGYPMQPAAPEYGYASTPEPAQAASAAPGSSMPLELDTALPQEPRPASIVSQINDILQQKVSASPLSWRKISLVEHPNQGIVVQVGMDQYSDVDEVPDPTIRELIHAAVEEWEKRSG